MTGITLSLLAILIAILFFVIMLGLGVYYIFNQDKVHAWVLGDSPENYKHFFVTTPS